MRVRITPTLAALALATTAVSCAKPDNTATICTSRTHSVRLTDPGPADQRMTGDLCYRGSTPLDTIQVLVHGATYNRSYWSPPYMDGASYVDTATRAGYATYAIDLIGTGDSSHPTSSRVTLNAEAVALHDTITALRTGRIDGHRYTHVILVGHSAGVTVAWVEAARYRDINALVVMSLLHHTAPTAAELTVTPARDDPKYKDTHLDVGYVTTTHGNRSVFYDTDGSTPDIVDADEATKDTASTAMLEQSRPLTNSPPPDTAPSRRINAPVLIVIGDQDTLWCGPDTLDCTNPAAVLASEDLYYAPEAHLQVLVAPHTGHSLNMHHSAQSTFNDTIAWAWSTVPPSL